jgi:hypothetical protein
MNEVFLSVPERHRVFPDVFASRELRFNGDREAFGNGNFHEFIALLESGSGIWLNTKILACSKQMSDAIRRQLVLNWQLRLRKIDFESDEGLVCLWCHIEPAEECKLVFEMLLESVGQCMVKALTIDASLLCMPNRQKFFSSEALRKFLTRNHLLKNLTLLGLSLPANACGIVGRLALNLDSLEIGYCELGEMQLFANGIGRNVSGPKTIVFRNPHYKMERNLEVDFSTVIVPLLNNSKLQVLHLLDVPNQPTKGGNLRNVKAALQSSQSLEELRISWWLDIQHSDQQKLLLEGIAAVPKLRLLQLELKNYRTAVSSLEQCTMFANALKEYQNNSLECFIDTFRGGLMTCNNQCYEETLNREVIPIIDFNRERHLYHNRLSKNYRKQNVQLVQALTTANITDNQHLRFWLVRNHAGDLCCALGGDEQAYSFLAEAASLLQIL